MRLLQCLKFRKRYVTHFRRGGVWIWIYDVRCCQANQWKFQVVCSELDIHFPPPGTPKVGIPNKCCDDKGPELSLVGFTSWIEEGHH